MLLVQKQACFELARCQQALGVTAPTSKAVFFHCFTEQHWCSEREQGPKALVLRISAELQQSCARCQTYRCDCTDKQGCFHLASQSSTGAVSVNRVPGFGAAHLC